MPALAKRAVAYGFVVLLGLFAALPSLLPPDQRGALPDWYAATHFNLGLDLRGGSYLLLEADVEQLLIDENQRTADELSRRLRTAGIRHGEVRVDSTGLSLPLGDGDPTQALQLARELSNAASPVRSHDVAVSGGRLLLEVNGAWRQGRVEAAMAQSLDVVRRRLDESGLVEPSITRNGATGIEVQLPGVEDPARLRALLGTTAQLNFHWLAREGGDAEVVVLPGREPGERYALERRVALEGRHVADAQASYDRQTGQPVVHFRLDGEGGRRFGEMTSANVGRPLAVVLDGRVITAPVIRTPILGGSGEISGSFDSAGAIDLAVMLRAGALPARLEVAGQGTVGPNLGSDAIRMGLVSGLAGGVLVLLFMIACYGRWGLLACAGLVVNVLLIFAVLGVLGGTLTLPGIAGIILGVGMAVDANILINERIREETRRGHRAWAALDLGFRRAWATILDSNMTSLIAISLLFLIGSGPVQGFAVTMGLGLIISMFTAVSVTRLLMEWRVARLGRRRLEMGGLPVLRRLSERLGDGGRVIPFMRAGTAGLVLSALLSAGSVALMFTPGMDYGIDFSGGALVEVHGVDADIEELRGAMDAAGLERLVIQDGGEAGRYQLRMAPEDGVVGEGVLDAVQAAVREAAPEAVIDRAAMVGPKVSEDFADLSMLAVLLAGLGMLGYLWLRFENHFAMAAILTIALDLTKTIGFFVLAGVEFNLTAVAALLALIGYSVNDKVVVFDRVRENLRNAPEMPFEAILDSSISSTLTRTVLTSGTALVALLPMALFGGQAVASFALPMLFGIVVGTSSSIFIASPILLRLARRRARLGLPQLQSEEDVSREDGVATATR